jgi:hypothetical protein
MSGLGQRERAVLAAVARHFSATWEKGRRSVRRLSQDRREANCRRGQDNKQRIAERGGLTKPRLRFDRVALGFVRRLQAALSASVPDGRTLILTITAPHTGAREDGCGAGRQRPDLSRAAIRRGGGQAHDPWKSDPGSSCEGRLKTNNEGDRVRAQSRFRSGRSLRHHAFIDRAHRRESMQGRAGKIRGRSMARSRRRRPVIVHRAVSTCLFPVVHPDRLQEGSNGSCRWADRDPDRVKAHRAGSR